MKKWFLGVTIAACALLFALRSPAGAGERWLVSIPHLDVREVPVAGLPKPQRESVVGIKVTVAGGAIASLRDVPVGWSIVIDNDPSWNTTLTATVIVASAALSPEYLSKSFLAISKAPPGTARESEQPDVHVEVAVSADFEHERRLSFRPKDLLLIKEPQ